MDVSVLLVSGSLRGESTNTALLRTGRLVSPPGVTGLLYRGLSTLPHFNPDDEADGLPAGAARPRQAVDEADAIAFSTPEYAEPLPLSPLTPEPGPARDGEAACCRRSTVVVDVATGDRAPHRLTLADAPVADHAAFADAGVQVVSVRVDRRLRVTLRPSLLEVRVEGHPIALGSPAVGRSTGRDRTTTSASHRFRG